MIPSGVSPLNLAAMACLGLAAIGIFLTWIEPASGVSAAESSTGIEQGDGILALVVCAAGFAAALVGARPAWIAAGLGTAIGVRDVTRVADDPATDVGLGLWVTTIGFTLATALLLASLSRTVMDARRDAG